MKPIQMLICLAILSAHALPAQWLHHTTPGVPRLADGRADWAAPAPRASDGHSDLSGEWRMSPNRYGSDLTRDLKPEEIQPWARALHKKRADSLDSAYTSCLPLGPLNTTGSVVEFTEGLKIIQTTSVIVFLYPDLTYRQVFLDGRLLEKNPNPAWMGYSVGRWEGDTLVVESNGYNDRTWLDLEGNPHSEELRITERFHRTAFGNMELSVTLEDPAVYARPIRFETKLQAITDTEMLEYVCAENERDRRHLSGSPDLTPVALSSEELSKFVGTYTSPNPYGPGSIASKVTLSGGQLVMDTPLGPTTLRAIGKSTFSADGAIVRFLEEDGAMAVISSAVEGDFKAVRKP